MKSIQFFGAVGTVTGSCTILTGDNGGQILVDLGMFQGDEKTEKMNYLPLGFDPARLTGVLLTHAHLDHSGRLPLLVKNGFKGKIYMTRATRMLTALILIDSAKIALEENTHSGYIQQGIGHEILYFQEDVDAVLNCVEEIEYDLAFTLGEFEVTFRDAGHILGSAIIEVTDASKKTIVFSGDLGNSPEDMIRPTKKIQKAEYVVMESTYGSRLHKEEDPSQVLLEEISEIEKTKGVLLIPSFSIERAQEILHRLNHLKNDKKIDPATKVFLDSPMSIRALEIFRRSPELYNNELTKELKTDDPFDFPGLVLCPEAQDSKSIILDPRPKVIISGSGMMHGGRILHHAVNYLPDTRTRLLLVGYQAPGTLGHLLDSGMTRVRIYDQEVTVAAHVRMLEAMSCHADQKKLLSWLGSIKSVQKVFLNHGEDSSRRALKEKLAEAGRLDIILPQLNDIISF